MGIINFINININEIIKNNAVSLLKNYSDKILVRNYEGFQIYQLSRKGEEKYRKNTIDYPIKSIVLFDDGDIEIFFENKKIIPSSIVVFNNSKLLELLKKYNKN